MAGNERDGLVIDCSGCPRAAVGSCEDCIVSFLVDRQPGAIVFDVEEERALRALRDGGLLPEARWDRNTG